MNSLFHERAAGHTNKSYWPRLEAVRSQTACLCQISSPPPQLEMIGAVVSALCKWKVVRGSVTSHGLNSQQLCVNSLQCLPNSVCNISHPAPPKDTGLYYFLFQWDSLDEAVAGLGGWERGLSDVADSSGCFRQLEVCRSLLVMLLSFVFRGNNCTPRSFREESHITDAQDPLMLRTFFSTFRSRKFEWQTSGDNGKQLGLIDSTTGIRPTVLIWDDSSSLSGGDVLETKLWYLFRYSADLTEQLIWAPLNHKQLATVDSKKLIGIHFWFKTARRLIRLLCHKVIYYPWSCCVFLDTPQCHGPVFFFCFFFSF